MLWRRVLRAFNYGDVLITMGTGQLTENEECGLGLAGQHDYSVIDVKEVRGQPLFLVKNPWSSGQVWKGQTRYEHLLAIIDESATSPNKHMDAPVNARNPRCLAPGSFWMPFNDVLQSFESLYLNWNPVLFSYRRDMHFRWELYRSRIADGCLASNPQFDVRAETASVLWILLSRHFADSREGEAAEKDPGFISLYAFKNRGQRVILSDEAIAHSPYVDSPNALLKVSLRAGEALIVAVSEQNLTVRVHSFSLSVLSLSPIELTPATEKHAHNIVLQGAWTAATSGGNASSPFYHINPQFSLDLARSSDISLVLRATTDWPVQVSMVWANGKQVRSITTRDIVGDSGEYRKGVAVAEIPEVPLGVYTIVCSTFEQGQTGGFRLFVGSDNACQLDRVAEATAGRFVTKLEHALLTPGRDHLLTPLITHRLNRISVSAKSQQSPAMADQQYCSPVKVSIQHSRGPSMRTIVSSSEGQYEDARHVGVHTPDADIVPDMCVWGLYIALHRLGSSGLLHNEQVEVQILSDAPVEVGPWMSGDY